MSNKKKKNLKQAFKEMKKTLINKSKRAQIQLKRNKFLKLKEQKTKLNTLRVMKKMLIVWMQTKLEYLEFQEVQKKRSKGINKKSENPSRRTQNKKITNQ